MADDRDDDRVSLPLDPRVALKALLAVEPESPPAREREGDQDDQDDQNLDKRDVERPA